MRRPFIPLVLATAAAATAGLWGCFKTDSNALRSPEPASPAVQMYSTKGVIESIEPGARSIQIRHEAIPGFMDAMTMSFRVRSSRLVSGLRSGDEITFRLNVTDTESWIDQIARTGNRHRTRELAPIGSSLDTESGPEAGDHPLVDYPFTNELGKIERLRDYRGRALAITFFFTRCPIPEYCPRLTKNFAEAAHLLESNPNMPTNWHFLSVTIDPEFDTPERLRAYAQSYGYNPNRWSFLTGPVAGIQALAHQSGVQYSREGGLLNHNFRTLIVDPSGQVRSSFPMGGNLADAIAKEIRNVVEHVTHAREGG